MAILAPVLLLFAGCVSTRRFTIDAVQAPRPAAEAESFRLVNGNPELTEEDDRYANIAGYVRTALSSKGLYEAPEGVAPDMVVEVDFGVDDLGRTVETVGWESIDGYEYRRKTTVVYDKFLRITARENPEPAEPAAPQELWSVYVTNEDEENDPEIYAVLLVSAAMDAVGASTAGEEEIVIADNDRRITFVERGL